MRDGWRRLSVADASVMVKRGRAPVYVEAGGELVFSQKCVRDGRVDDRLARRTDATKRQVPDWAWVQPGDTLVNSTGRGTVGRAGFVRSLADRATVDSHLTIVRPKPSVVVPDYLGILLHSAKDELEGMASGSTNQTELSANSILEIPILLPPLDEQRRIVDLVAAVDEAIEATELEEEAMGVHLSSLRSELIESSDAPRVTLSDVLLRVEGGRSPITEGRPPEPGERSVLKLSAVRPGQFRASETKAVSPDIPLPASSLVNAGDVLITRSNTPTTVGAVCFVVEVGPHTYLSDLTLRMVPQSDCLPAYLAAALNTDDARRQIVSSARGTSGSMRKISRQAIARYTIPMPNKDKQGSVVHLLDAASAVLNDVLAFREALRSLRSALLADLLSGDHEIPASYDALLSA